MMTDIAERYVKFHDDNLAVARMSSNGGRNIEFNKQAGASLQLAVGSGGLLSVDKVQADYEVLGASIGLDKAEVKGALGSALKFAQTNPRSLDDNQSSPPPTQRKNYKIEPVYSKLAEYAQSHGTPEEEFIKAKWEIGMHMNRPCFIVPHEDKIKRARFIDGGKMKWMPIGKTGGKCCWYGFRNAVKMASEHPSKTIVITNGQPSVIAGQYHGVPALAQTDGEGKAIQDDLFKRLLDAIKKHNLSVCLAYDGDDAGRAATKQKTKQFTDNGIIPSVVNFGGDDGFDLADYCKKTKSRTETMQWLLNLAAFSRRDVEVVMTGHKLADEFEQSLRFPGKSLSPGEMVVTPMKQLHQLGGYAKVLHPAMMTEIIAPSGGGKTSFMETWIDEFRKTGLHVLWYSPEWSPKVMHLRSIQRHGGGNADDYWDNVLWNKEAEIGIAGHERKGKPLLISSPAGKEALRINGEIRKWPGEIHCFQSPAVTEIILAQMTARLQYLRRCGVRVGVAFFDYAQLLHTTDVEPGRNSYEIIVSKVKTWCKNNWIHGIMGSQVTKDLARASLDKGRLLGEYDSSWVSPNEFNLIMSLNIVYSELLDADGKRIKTNTAIINTCKNSTGQVGVVKMVTDFPRLRWIDKAW